QRWFHSFKDIRLVNAYGPTEASDDITHNIMEGFPNKRNVPIGNPIQNTSIYILDENLRLSPIGVKGELYVGGICVGLGYTDKEKTEEAFIRNPFYTDETIYKTGDVVR